MLVARHADVYNPRDVVYGRLPRFGLSKLGWGQAKRPAQFLAPIPVAALYSTPIAGHGKPPE